MAARDIRASVLGVQRSSPRLEQNASGSIGALGRQMAALCYVGILAAVPTVLAPRTIAFVTWNTADTLITWNVSSTVTTWNQAATATTVDS